MLPASRGYTCQGGHAASGHNDTRKPTTLPPPAHLPPPFFIACSRGKEISNKSTVGKQIDRRTD